MSRYCLVLAEQPHRLVFAEAVEALVWGLRELAHEVEASTLPHPHARNIIFAPHLLLASEENPRIEPGTIVYNGEPWCSPLFVRSLRLLGHPNVIAWDYWRRTTEFLLGLGIPARTLPYAWAPSLERRRGEHETARDVDVLFMGSFSPRRGRVLEEIRRLAPDLCLHTLSGTYGAERDAWLLRSKVCLNVHYWDDGGNEDLRIVYACANRVAVVSEGPAEEAHREPWALWAPYAEVAQTAVEAVRSGEWKRQAARGYAAVQFHDAATLLRSVLED